MFIAHLTLTSFRNIAVPLQLTFQKTLNVIYGANAAGKTSILEAIYYLAFGKSFRTFRTNDLITQGQQHFQLTAIVRNGQTIQVASGRDLHNQKSLKLNQKKATQLMLHQALPLQMIYASDVLSLYTPKTRVQLMDRGVFLYFGADFWQQYSCYEKLFTQYRAALKRNYHVKHLAILHATMLPYALQLHRYRQKYLVAFKKELHHYLPVPLQQIDIQYYAGWDANLDLALLWSQSLSRYPLLPVLQHGPQRCNIAFVIQQRCVTKVLSRGEMKLVMIAIKLSQGRLAARQHGRASIYLVDDLSSELDQVHQHYVLNLFRQLEAQVIMTNIAPLDSQYHTIDLASVLASGTKSHL